MSSRCTSSPVEKSISFLFLPLPSVPVWLKICYLKRLLFLQSLSLSLNRNLEADSQNLLHSILRQELNKKSEIREISFLKILFFLLVFLIFYFFFRSCLSILSQILEISLYFSQIKDVIKFVDCSLNIYVIKLRRVQIRQHQDRKFCKTQTLK